MFELFQRFWASRRFPGYLPQPVTWKTVDRWIKQFDAADRKHLYRLLESVIYLSEADVKKILVDQNGVLMRRLEEAGVPADKLIYVQVDEAGSSSPVMLNLLRDAAQLEQRGCSFVDANDTLRINRLTDDLESGALIYVDDFVGTGTQFCTARDFAFQHVEGSFSEHLLVPCICEEGLREVWDRGIDAYYGHVHSKVERPLHKNSTLLDRETKRRLIDLCRLVDPTMGVGFMNTASMVVLYRNAPDNIPILFRGSAGQQPYVGIFPRTTDFPLSPLPG